MIWGDSAGPSVAQIDGTAAALQVHDPQQQLRQLLPVGRVPNKDQDLLAFHHQEAQAQEAPTKENILHPGSPHRRPPHQLKEHSDWGHNPHQRLYGIPGQGPAPALLLQHLHLK